MPDLPPSFVEQLSSDIGLEETEKFIRAMSQKAPVSVLMNRFKQLNELFASSRDVPWCPYGKYLAGRPSFVMDPIHHAGGYYVMEASSMILWRAMHSLFGDTRPSTVLDMCAAPGGKSMVLSSFLGNVGLLVSNEVNRGRFGILNENTARWGMANVITSNGDPSRINIHQLFDCVVVDAPCSGEGMFRKTLVAIEEWSKSHVHHCSLRQRRILSEAVKLVADGGYLIYSTCTYNNEENIANMAWLRDHFECESVSLELGEGPVRVEHDGVIGHQCWPHRMKGEGLFIAALKMKSGGKRPRLKDPKRPIFTKASKEENQAWSAFISPETAIEVYLNKNGEYLGFPKQQSLLIRNLAQHFPGFTPSLKLGEIKRGKPIPHHNLVLSTALSPNLTRVELSLSEAITFLRKEVPSMQISGEGWQVVTHEGMSLGWIKVVGGKVKNYLPTNLRIRKQ